MYLHFTPPVWDSPCSGTIDHQHSEVHHTTSYGEGHHVYDMYTTCIIMVKFTHQ